MEQTRTVVRAELKTGLYIVSAVIAVVVVAFFVIWSLPDDGRRDVLYFAQDYIPIVMFLSLACLLFSGFPVAFILGGLAILFGLIGYFLEVFSLIEFFNFLPRIWGQAAENLVLVAVPAFVFMGVMMERSGIANDLLYCVQVLLKRVPGALALGVTIMGTILAAMTGIIGASVTMMTALALPTMLKQKYSPALSCGVIAASGTLGILIPPSIMLIIMADLMAVSVGNVFMAALLPGLVLAALYLIVRGGDRQPAAVDRPAPASRHADRSQGGAGAVAHARVRPAGIPHLSHQGLDPVRLGHAERGRRGGRGGGHHPGRGGGEPEEERAHRGLPHLGPGRWR